MNVEAKVGFFVLGAILLLAFGAAFVGNITIGGGGYEFIVNFQFSGDLRIRSKVKMAGGEVIGSVTHIGYDDQAGSTMVRIRAREGVKLKKDAKFTILTSGLMGEKYINASGGTAGVGYIQAGETVQGETPADMAQAMQTVTDAVKQFQEVLGTVNTMLGAKGTRNALADTMSSLSKTAQESHPKVVNILTNLETMTASMSKASRGLDDMSEAMTKMMGEKNQAALAQSLENMKQATAKLNTAIQNVEALSQTLKSGEGPIGVLMTDKDMGKDLKALMKDLRANPSILIWGPKK
jgi:phospholipid/cholesterol/gamma-HCH transport system substrate-binding protein